MQRSSPTPGRPLKRCTPRLSQRSESVSPAKVDGRDYEARRIPHIIGEIHPGQLAQAIGRMLPPGGIVLADAGAHLAWMGYYIELQEGQNFRKPGSFGPMAGHTNGAIGVKLAHPDRAVVVGCGDGCYNLSGFELMTAVEHRIPVIWIIFNDGEFKLIKAYQLLAYGETGLAEFQNPDFAAYARACGASGFKVETLEEFEAAYAEALAGNRPAIIDAKITRWAIPNYSSSPEGRLAGIFELIEERLRGALSVKVLRQGWKTCRNGMRHSQAAAPKPSIGPSRSLRRTSCWRSSRRRRPQRRKASIAPSMPRQRWRLMEPSCGFSTRCLPIWSPGTRSRALPTPPSCGSPTLRRRVRTTTSPICAVSPCATSSRRTNSTTCSRPISPCPTRATHASSWRSRWRPPAGGCSARSACSS